MAAIWIHPKEKSEEIKRIDWRCGVDAKTIAIDCSPDELDILRVADVPIIFLASEIIVVSKQLCKENLIYNFNNLLWQPKQVFSVRSYILIKLDTNKYTEQLTSLQGFRIGIDATLLLSMVTSSTPLNSIQSANATLDLKVQGNLV